MGAKWLHEFAFGNATSDRGDFRVVAGSETTSFVSFLRLARPIRAAINCAKLKTEN
jgi:hypothetical protein